jgi:uncharacterized membrane protein YsdA (DUF1294 family)
LLRIVWILVGLALSGAAAWGASARLSFDPLLAWLAGVNLVALILYGLDKALSGLKWPRVPEATLLVVALAGGTVGALAGMQLFRHKTRKTSFGVKFWLVVVLQVALVVLWFAWLRPRLRSDPPGGRAGARGTEVPVAQERARR